jgi:ABC-type nitrate/sulfonate/bicarbonate transport system ATPase subunit
MRLAPKLETRHLSKWFTKADGGAIEALRAINLQVAEGEFVSLVGASGSGKTTLLRLVDGLQPPTSGEVLLDGRPIRGPAPDRGFVFQQDCLMPWRTVLDNVGLGLKLKGVARREREETSRRLLEIVGLTDFARHYPHELSGGMRQRVNLARALAIDPEVLLMDEPFAALDAQTREIMQAELLKVWNQAARKTVLFVTHQIDEAVFLADRVIVFTVRPGRVKEVVPVELPRPRSLELKRTPEFVAIVDHIWRLIEQEVRAGMLLTSA